MNDSHRLVFIIFKLFSTDKIVGQILTEMEDFARALSVFNLQPGARNQADMAQQNQPSEEHLAFIPDYLNDNVITLSATRLSRNSMKTVLIGITTRIYTPSMWDEDARRWTSHFQLLRQNCIEVKMLEMRDSPGKVDCARAIVEINRALEDLSNVPCGEFIRVIFLGPGLSQLTLDTLTYLVREWKTPENTDRKSADKKLQVVTTGELQKTAMGKDYSMFNLCKKLCIAGVCQSIEFYDTMEYYPFGHYRKSYFFKD